MKKEPKKSTYMSNDRQLSREYIIIFVLSVSRLTGEIFTYKYYHSLGR